MRKKRMYLKELTDEEIDVFKKSLKYQEDEVFHEAIDVEYRYRFERKIQ